MVDWKEFWTWIYITGLGSFALVSLIIIPLGLRDLLRLLRELAEEHEQESGNEIEMKTNDDTHRV